MSRRRNILFHGLSITVRRLPAFLWTYVFNLALAFLFSIGLNLRLSAVLDHSLASQRLTNGFDLAAAAETMLHLSEGPGGRSITHSDILSVFVFFLAYFVLVPGTLFCYITRTRARLNTLLRQGLLHFWRFVRITLVALVVALLILGLLSQLQSHWSTFVDNRFVGRISLVLTLIGTAFVLLVASLLRLYFDLVEAYTVQLGTLLQRNGKPDRRTRRAYRPAFQTLRHNFFRAWLTFLLLAVIGAAAIVLASRTTLHMLAQPRVWPMFLIMQAGLLVMLFTRFWQRGIEASLILQTPIQADAPLGNPHRATFTPLPPPLAPVPPPASAPDPIPNPEPAPPSLDNPDPGVFHHNPQKPEN